MTDSQHPNTTTADALTLGITANAALGDVIQRLYELEDLVDELAGHLEHEPAGVPQVAAPGLLALARYGARLRRSVRERAEEATTPSA